MASFASSSCVPLLMSKKMYIYQESDNNITFYLLISQAASKRVSRESFLSITRMWGGVIST